VRGDLFEGCRHALAVSDIDLDRQAGSRELSGNRIEGRTRASQERDARPGPRQAQGSGTANAAAPARNHHDTTFQGSIFT